MSRSFSLWAFGLILVSEVLYFVYAVLAFHNKGWLPSPFYFDVSDTFMDFYNTAYWSYNEGRYDLWRSIYPMFSFLLGHYMTNPECVLKVQDAFELRSCDPRAIGYLFAAYLIGSALVAKVVIDTMGSKNKLSARILVFLFFWLSVLLCLPGLIAIERGNFIVFAFLALSFVAASHLGIVSAVCLAIAISLKQYLAVLLVVPYVKKQFGYVGLVLLGVVCLQSISMVFVPESHADLLLENMVGFNGSMAISFFDKMWNPTSIQAWVKVFDNATEVLKFLPYDIATFIGVAMSLVVAINRLCFIAGILLLLNSGVQKLEDSYLIFYLLLGLLVVTDSIGGYGLLLLVPFWGKTFRYMRVVCPMAALGIVVLYVPFEIPFSPERPCDMFFSYLGNIACDGYSKVTLGAYMRPIILMLLHLWMVLDFVKVTEWFNNSSEIERVISLENRV